MSSKFDGYVGQLRELLKRLKSAEPIKLTEIRKFSTAGGCYVLLEKGNHQYVGITKNLKRRMKDHTCGRPEKSAFALKLARLSTKKRANYKASGSPKKLMKDPIFVAAMQKTTQRVRKMKAKCVTISDPNVRYLFEFFAAVSLRSPHNDFNLH